MTEAKAGQVADWQEIEAKTPVAGHAWTRHVLDNQTEHCKPLARLIGPNDERILAICQFRYGGPKTLYQHEFLKYEGGKLFLNVNRLYWLAGLSGVKNMVRPAFERLVYLGALVVNQKGSDAAGDEIVQVNSAVTSLLAWGKAAFVTGRRP